MSDWITEMRQRTPECCKPNPDCVDPDAPVVPCANAVNCGWHVHTCERTEPVGPGNNYLCPAHGDGFEEGGRWYCSAACFYELQCDQLRAQLAAAEEFKKDVQHISQRLTAETYDKSLHLAARSLARVYTDDLRAALAAYDKAQENQR